jgi:hypothetical protein
MYALSRHTIRVSMHIVRVPVSVGRVHRDADLWPEPNARSCPAVYRQYIMYGLQRGTRDTPNSMGAERRRGRCQTQTDASHTRHTHTRQALDPPTQVSQGDRTTGNPGQPQPPRTRDNRGRATGRTTGARPDTRVRAYKPDQPRDALPRHKATLSSQSAPEMKAARERPGPPACTAWSAKSPSRRPKDSTDIGTKCRAEDTLRHGRRLEASWVAAADPGVHAAPPAEVDAAGWMTETSPTTNLRGRTNMMSHRAPIIVNGWFISYAHQRDVRFFRGVPVSALPQILEQAQRS